MSKIALPWIVPCLLGERREERIASPAPSVCDFHLKVFVADDRARGTVCGRYVGPSCAAPGPRRPHRGGRRRSVAQGPRLVARKGRAGAPGRGIAGGSA